MSMRLTRTFAGAARLRPSASAFKAVQTPAAAVSVRHNSGVPAQQDPKAKAQSLIDALPGNSLISKTAILSTTAALSIAAISNELYVVNEETIVAISLGSVFYAIGAMGGPAYSEWASGQVQKIKDILGAARSDHKKAVQERIESVSQLSDVVNITKSLFAVSKETAELEAKAFELEQRTNFAAEAKSVLDSWVRYEASVKQRQQKELAEALMAQVQKELANPKALQQILQQSVADVERIVASK